MRFGSARYSVPNRLIGATVLLSVTDTRVHVMEGFTGEVVADHGLVAPGEVSIVDAHYGSTRPDKPRRAPRAKTVPEKRFLALGPVAEALLVGAAAAGVNKLPAELAQILVLHDAHGEPALLAAIGRSRVDNDATDCGAHPVDSPHQRARCQSTRNLRLRALTGTGRGATIPRR